MLVEDGWRVEWMCLEAGSSKPLDTAVGGEFEAATIRWWVASSKQPLETRARVLIVVDSVSPCFFYHLRFW